MAEKLSTEPYKGVRDFYPEDWARMEAMFGTVRSVLVRAGYEEYQASPLERAELYEAKTSEEIVGEQTYTFTDRGDRRVTLRSEMTPSLARMVAAKRRELPFPLKWFSIGNRFRYERPQKGRLREFYQMDIDLIGAPEGEADLEIVSLVGDLMRAFGAEPSDYAIRMNSRPLLNAACDAAGLSGEEVKRYLRLLDRKSKMSDEDFAAARSEIVDTDPLALIEDSGSAPEVAREKRTLLDRIETLAARGTTRVVFDPAVTRGFDYYTGMVFEVFDADPKNARSLFGGGRYDGLVALFGGDPIPAIGFALGDVTLADFIEAHGIGLDTRANRPQLYLGTVGASDIPAAQAFAKTLREQGCRVFVNITDRAIGDQIKDALKRGIDFFVAYGDEEVATGTVRLKQLSTALETGMPGTELPLHLERNT
jgi:histidyl-tRNA synthetase